MENRFLNKDLTFINACEYGSMFRVDLWKDWVLHPDTRPKAFLVACKNGHFPIVVFLYRDQTFNTSNFYYSTYYEAFIQACKSEDLKNACEDEYLAGAQWLLEKIKLKDNRWEPVGSEWLLRKTKLDDNRLKPTQDHELIRDEDRNKRYELGDIKKNKYGHGIGYISVPNDYDDELLERAFIQAVKKGRLKVCLWLQSLRPYAFVINYRSNGSMRGGRFLTKEEEQRRKQRIQALWLEKVHHNIIGVHDNIIGVLSPDIFRNVVKYI
jgi:hypothetical protein